MKLLRIAALPASALLALGLAAGPASAAAKTVVSTYTCTKQVTDEFCALSVTVTGAVKDYKVTITAPKAEALTFSYAAVEVPVSVAGNGGAMGSSRPVVIHAPYTLPGGVVTKGNKMVGDYMVTVPLNAAHPVVTLTATK